jgi:hypothetical protein
MRLAKRGTRRRGWGTQHVGTRRASPAGSGASRVFPEYAGVVSRVQRGWVFAIVVGMIGCSSGGDDPSRTGETCSRGTTTAACDTCAQTACKEKYRAAFYERQSHLGDVTPDGACIESVRCIAHCPCGDTDCYDHCPPTVACSASLFALRNCEAVRCPTECSAALEGVSGGCIDLFACCNSPRMPEGVRSTCLNAAASLSVASCEGFLGSYRSAGNCD